MNTARPEQATQTAETTSLPSLQPILSATLPSVATDKVSPAVYAGAWYSSDPDRLAAEIDGYLANVQAVDGSPLVLIAPQTQYAFSGEISAAGYKQLQNAHYDTAVILATAMYPPHPTAIAVWEEGGFMTPLGLVEVDSALARSIIAADPLIKGDSQVFVNEPGIEIQLPFLQRVCTKCRIVPILIDDNNDTAVMVLARVLAVNLRQGKNVLIASSNLSQYPSQNDAMPLDNETLTAIETGHAAVFAETVKKCRLKDIPNLETCANGETAVRTAMNTANLLGAETVSILNYGNSGDSANGDPERVTSYGVVMFWHFEPPVLTEENRQFLLSLARTALMNHLNNEKITLTIPDEPVFQQKSGAFVILKLDGKFRGSMGHMRADLPLSIVVQEMALAALTSDPRFTPLIPADLQRLKIEISITSPPHHLDSTDEVVLGLHGLLIQERNHQGVLLPQVQIENQWGRNRYLDHLCMIAGLPVNCWKKGTALYSFTTVTFGE